MSLFRRKPGGVMLLEDIERARAHRILDRYRAGSPETQTRINWALRMTGDLTADMKGLDDDSDDEMYNRINSVRRERADDRDSNLRGGQVHGIGQRRDEINAAQHAASQGRGE